VFPPAVGVPGAVHPGGGRGWSPGPGAPPVLRLVECSAAGPRRGRGPDGRSRYAMLETLRDFSKPGCWPGPGSRTRRRRRWPRYAGGRSRGGRGPECRPPRGSWLGALWAGCRGCHHGACAGLGGWSMIPDMAGRAGDRAEACCGGCCAGGLAGQGPLLRELAGRAGPGPALGGAPRRSGWPGPRSGGGRPAPGTAAVRPRSWRPSGTGAAVPAAGGLPDRAVGDLG